MPPSSTLALSLIVCCCALNLIGQCQDLGFIKQRISASLSKIENYPAAIVKGETNYRSKIRGKAHLQFRGRKMWMELDTAATAEPDEKRRLLSTYEVMGTKDFPYTAEFDGKRLYEFKPYTLTLTIQTTNATPAIFDESVFLPKNWLHMGGNSEETFRDFIEIQKYETKVEPLPNGRWKLSQENLGSLLPGGNSRVAIRDRYIVVDENCDYLVTEYWGKGAQGTLAGTLEWAQEDGKWYPKKGKQTFGKKPYAEWTIDEISFDASKCRTKFDDLESLVPFATCVMKIDEKYNEISRQYKGGAEGEAEFKLRELAWIKRKKEGF